MQTELTLRTGSQADNCNDLLGVAHSTLISMLYHIEYVSLIMS